MVKLHTSLLAITLATGSALAASRPRPVKKVNDASASGQRPDPSLGLLQAPPDAHYQQIVSMAEFLHAPRIRELVDEPEEDLLVRDLDFSDDLETREPGGGRGAAGLVKFGRSVVRNIRNHGSTAFNVASTGAMIYGAVSQPSRRDLEDSEDLLERDLDVEELFGREYVPLDERDIIDDDLEADEFYGREYNLLDEQYY